MEKTWKPMVAVILWIITIPFFIIGVLGIIGGIYSLQRKMWGLALAGAVASTVYWFFVGIPTIVFIAQSKDEFE